MISVIGITIVKLGNSIEISSKDIPNEINVVINVAVPAKIEIMV